MKRIVIVFRADDPRLVTGRIPGSLPGLCDRCERPVEVTPGTRASFPDAALVCTGCLTPDEIQQACSQRHFQPLTSWQVEEILDYLFAR
jgi:hypothetical protein